MTPRHSVRIIPVSSLPQPKGDGDLHMLGYSVVIGRKSTLRAGLHRRQVVSDFQSQFSSDIPEDMENILYGPAPDLPEQ